MRSFKTYALVLGILTSISNSTSLRADELELSSGGALTVEATDNLMALENLRRLFPDPKNSYEFFGRDADGDRIKVNILINQLLDSEGRSTSIPDSAIITLLNESTKQLVAFVLTRSTRDSYVTEHTWNRMMAKVENGVNIRRESKTLTVDQRRQMKFWFMSRGQRQQLRIEMSDNGLDVSVRQGGRFFGSNMSCSVDLKDIASRTHRQTSIKPRWVGGEVLLP